MSLARDIVDRIFFPGRDVHAIPVLDGGFSPNQRLEEGERLAEFTAPDAMALGPEGRLYVSAGKTVFACAGERFQSRSVFAEFPTTVGALAWTPDGRLLVALAGTGLAALDREGRRIGELADVAGERLRCPTAIAVARDGTVFVADGSRHNGPEEWLGDLMQNRPPSGRLVACDGDLSNARVLASDLSWPAGVVVAHDEAEILVTEAWAHRLSAIARDSGKPRELVGNFAGYPSRLARASDGSYWAAFFALRTQLTEFVLREHRFRERMMEKVPAELWIGPSLGGRFDYREPTQIGRIKKLGIQKPWAPARSYGLVARLNGRGYAIESLHSRAAGTLHGVTSVLERGRELLVLSKGHGRLVAVPLGGERQ